MIGAASRPRASSAVRELAGTRKLTCSPSTRRATLMPMTWPSSSSAGPPLIPAESAPPKKICG